MKPLHLQLTGRSMHPTIKSGEHVIVQPLPWSGVQVGDIIAFNHWQHRKPVVHRVVKTKSNGRFKRRLRCKGDNNRWMDMGWIVERHYLGAVTHVEGRQVNEKKGLLEI